MSDIQIIPAILATNKQELQKQVAKIQSADSLKGHWVHFDLMDNKFVPNLSIGPSEMSDQLTEFRKEAHLMVENPQEMLAELDRFQRVIVHVESKEVKKTLNDLNTEKKESGIAIEYKTPLENIFPYLLDIDLVLVMSIEAGFQGQPFINGVLERIKQIAKLKEEKQLKFKIAVDGAVKDTNANLLVAAGVDQLVVGSFLQEGDIEENMEKLWEAIR